jgi:23S rRNA (uracil1939-C5)-methyltransferase
MPLEDVTLDKYVYGGEVLGRLPDGRAVFVPFAIPGERVRIRVVEDKPRYARAELVEVLEQAPQRTQPRCIHYSQCGGCHYQHLPYPKQLALKAKVLGDQLARIGKLPDPPLQPTVASPHPWYYRNNVQFHLSPDGQLGYQKPRQQGVLAIQECHLPEDPLNETWPQLDIDAIPGLERVGLRLGADDERLLILESSDPQPVSLHLDLPLSVLYKGPGGTLVLAGEDHVVIEVRERLFRVSGDSFFQVNTPMAEKLVAHLLEHLPLAGKPTLVEAYCGVGLFSAFLAPHVGRLVAIEASASACDDFAVNLDEFDHVELYQAPVEDVLPALTLQPEVVLVDPPRSGLDRRALDALLSLGPQTLAYVSCDPATLSRDARRLTRGGYQLESITPFDLFPQTYHIESISYWAKA